MINKTNSSTYRLLTTTQPQKRVSAENERFQFQNISCTHAPLGFLANEKKKLWPSPYPSGVRLFYH